ncbi:unnamed protein product [Pocillopora meandrina]|uniref:G-protein coupled receptors family 1 profile domain-containing protein n=1 Tax=Pocillopora meandrina TaxID=46732 RepID=A0AAU9W2J1_9CNID|nr:unnamed protein product [Pocillopora meandrina]
MMLISLLISAISYAKIYFRLRHQLLHVQGHVHQRQQLPPNGVVPTALNVARYKKTVSFIAWVQLGLFACYSPLCITLVSSHFVEFLDDNIIYFFLCLLFLNSSLNPILYCWKIREVKQAVKDIIRQEMLNTTDDYTNFSFEVGHLSGGRFGMSMAFTFLNVVLSMTASLGNVLILLALHKVTSIYPPTKLLFQCLAVTDLFVGVITQPLFTVTLLREEIMYFSEKLFEITYFIREVSSFFLCGVSVLTSTAISVDSAVDGSEIQTGCYIKAGASAHYLPLASSWCFSWIRPHFICFVSWTGCFDSYFSYYLGHCLRQYLFPSPPQLLHVQGHVHHQQLSPNGVLPTQLNVVRYKKTVSAI